MAWPLVLPIIGELHTGLLAARRLVDVLKIVLTQTTFRFSVEHRLPKVRRPARHRTVVIFPPGGPESWAFPQSPGDHSRGMFGVKGDPQPRAQVQVWTPFDVYLISCQILCCFIAPGTKSGSRGDVIG